MCNRVLESLDATYVRGKDMVDIKSSGKQSKEHILSLVSCSELHDCLGSGPVQLGNRYEQGCQT